MLKKASAIILFFIIHLLASSAYSQCSGDVYYDKQWRPLMKDFTHIKNYRIDGQGGDRQVIEYAAVFSESIDYRITVSSKDGKASGIVAKVLDSEKKLIATNSPNDEQLEVFTFSVQKTGIYYIQFTFQNSNSYCGFAASGFKRN